MPESTGPDLSRIATRTATLPDRVVMHTPTKWGKTSFFAQLDRVIFVTCRGEDGLQKLIETGQLPATPHFADIAMSWAEVVQATQALLTGKHDFQTVVFDTGNGMERLAQEQTCETDFGNDWSEGGFNAYGRGEKITTNRLWLPWLETLDELRETRGMRIILPCHTESRTLQNPEGQDYQKWEPAISKPAWKFTARWADMILFGAYDVQATKDTKNKLAKVKATGGKNRILHCTPSASYDAGNRYGLPDTIRLGNSPAEAMANLRASFPKRPKPESAQPRADPPRVDHLVNGVASGVVPK